MIDHISDKKTPSHCLFYTICVLTATLQNTGKTLTAEAISELLKKPLYVVTAGDLGITAAEVEKSFGGVLDLCSTW